MKKLTTITIERETARLVHAYCVVHDIRMQDFVTEVLRERLGSFESQFMKLWNNNSMKSE